MSMNLKAKATRSVWIKKNGELIESTQSKFIDVIQTPTDVTYAILECEFPYKAYIEHLKKLASSFTPELIDVFARGDIFRERAPIGQVLEDNPYILCLEQFEHDVAYAESEGYSIEYFAM